MLNSIIQEEITRLSLEIGVKPSTLENFAEFVIKSQKAKTTKPSSKVSKPKKVKPLSLAEVKAAVFNYFNAKDLKSLRNSTDFQIAVPENKSLNFQKKETWEDLYRQFVGILPHDIKPLSLNEVKAAVFNYFKVKDLKTLRSSTDFQLAVPENKSLNFQNKETWEDLYRQFVGILPHEVNEIGKDCINGINIFKYFYPWQVFNLNTNSSEQEIKSAYRELSKKYHPDNAQTGDARIFDRINTMYKSISPKTFRA